MESQKLEPCGSEAQQYGEIKKSDQKELAYESTMPLVESTNNKPKHESDPSKLEYDAQSMNTDEQLATISTGVQTDSPEGEFSAPVEEEKPGDDEIVAGEQNTVSEDEEEDEGFESFKKKLEEEEVALVESVAPRIIAVAEDGHKTRRLIRHSALSNYASIDCGAQIMANNKEAKNAVSVLMNNKDSYMLNPCKSDAYLIVELCDDIQVHSFELANFELYSSMIHEVDISISNIYPVREGSGGWTLLGHFTGEDTREAQRFTIQHPQHFAKYLKLEFVSHIGTEYYCPISILKVFGVTMVEDYNSRQAHDGLDIDEEDEHQEKFSLEAADSSEDVNTTSITANVIETIDRVVGMLFNTKPQPIAQDPVDADTSDIREHDHGHEGKNVSNTTSVDTKTGNTSVHTVNATLHSRITESISESNSVDDNADDTETLASSTTEQTTDSPTPDPLPKNTSTTEEQVTTTSVSSDDKVTDSVGTSDTTYSKVQALKKDDPLVSQNANEPQEEIHFAPSKSPIIPEAIESALSSLMPPTSPSSETQSRRSEANGRTQWTECIDATKLCSKWSSTPRECANKSLTIKHSAVRWDRPHSPVSCQQFQKMLLAYSATAYKAESNATVKPASTRPSKPIQPVDKKTSIFSQLSTQIKILEKNMSVAGLFLDQLGSRYKKLNTTVSQLRAERVLEIAQLREEMNATITNTSDAHFVLLGQLMLELINTTERMASSVQSVHDYVLEDARVNVRHGLVARIEQVLFSFVGTIVALFVYLGTASSSHRTN